MVPLIIKRGKLGPNRLLKRKLPYMLTNERTSVENKRFWKEIFYERIRWSDYTESNFFQGENTDCFTIPSDTLPAFHQVVQDFFHSSQVQNLVSSIEQMISVLQSCPVGKI